MSILSQHQLVKSALLFDTTLDSQNLMEGFMSAGYRIQAELQGVARDANAIRTVSNYGPDIIVMHLKTVEGVTLDFIGGLQEVNPKPVLVFTKRGTAEVFERVIEAGASACVIGSVATERIPSILTAALARFNVYHLLRKQLDEANNKLASRKLIEKAKGLLMEHRGMSEQDAYHSLRKMAMNNSLSLAVVAQSTIEVISLIDIKSNI